MCSLLMNSYLCDILNVIIKLQVVQHSYRYNVIYVTRLVISTQNTPIHIVVRIANYLSPILYELHKFCMLYQI